MGIEVIALIVRIIVKILLIAKRSNPWSRVGFQAIGAWGFRDSGLRHFWLRLSILCWRALVPPAI